MKFSTKKTNIENIISIMQPFLDKKDVSSINSHIYIEAKDNNIILKATDLEMGLEAKVKDLNIEENGSLTVNGSNLLNMIKRLKNEEIIFELDENILYIKQNKTEFKLPTFEPEEFPSFPNYDNMNPLNISGLTFIDSIKKITPSIDNSNPKHELNGACIDILENKINFVSTDTKRLSAVSIENFLNTNGLNFIISKKAVIEIQKLFFDEINILFSDTYFIVKNENLIFFTKLINGKFPNYERIISNQKNRIAVEIDKSKLIEGIKTVTSIKPFVVLDIQKNRIKLETIDDDTEAKTEISGNFDIEENIKIAINSKYILDFLSVINEEKIYLYYDESDLPIVLVSKDFKTIIMPLNLNKQGK